MYTISKGLKIILCLITFFFISAFLFTILAQVKIKAGNFEMDLNEKKGTIDSAEIGNYKLPLDSDQAFIEVKDVKSGGGFYPLLGEVIGTGNTYVLNGSVTELGITAKINFEVIDDVLFINMDFKNETSNDRGLVISTMFNFIGNNYIWEGGLYDEVHPQAHTLYGNNYVPITTLKDDSSTWGLAAAIPPDCPVFYDTHFEDGEFGIYYNIGITPLTVNFPNQANLEEMIYSVNPKWGFRSALSKYYLLFPNYYSPRIEEAGLWGTGDYMDKYPYPEDIKFFEAGGNGHPPINTIQDWADSNEIDKAKALNAYIFPYTIVGQRQIYNLYDWTLPYSSNKVLDEKSQIETALNLLKSWNTNNIIRFQDPNTANSFDSVEELKEMIYNSGLYNADNYPVVMARQYTGNTLTFPLNANPELFDDSTKMTIAKYTLDHYIPEFLEALPDITGIYFDSMGNWGTYLNYRREHFKYAQYPLSIDLLGNPIIPNVISLYEFVKEARDILHKQNKYVFANGVYDAGAKLPNGINDYDASKGTSRFFIGALCDVAGSESGANTPMWRMFLDRTIMGKKPYAILATDKNIGLTGMENYLKAGLLMDVFTSLTSYYNNSEDSVVAGLLHNTYLPLLKTLYQAGWEPETGVTGLSGVYCERYGTPSEGKTYLVVYNDSSSAKELSLNLDKEIFGGSITQATNIFGTMGTYPIVDNKIKIDLGPGELELLEIDNITQVSSDIPTPTKFKLSQNYPNPFNPTTVIKYTISKSGFVSLKVYNVLGQEVATLQQGFQKAGAYSTNFNASQLASGVYLYKLETNGMTATKKMILLK